MRHAENKKTLVAHSGSDAVKPLSDYAYSRHVSRVLHGISVPSACRHTDRLRMPLPPPIQQYMHKHGQRAWRAREKEKERGSTEPKIDLEEAKTGVDGSRGGVEGLQGLLVTFALWLAT